MKRFQSTPSFRASSLAIAVLSCVIGCSKGGDGNSPAVVDPFQPNVDAANNSAASDNSAATGASESANSQVTNGREVAVAEKPKSIELKLELALDPSSVSLDNVNVMSTDSESAMPTTVTGSVSYDVDAKKIVFQPSAKLAVDATYKVSLNGLRNQAGGLLPKIELPFGSEQANERRVVTLKDGKITSYMKAVLDPSGSVYSATYSDSGNILSAASYSSSGADGQWLTADDQVFMAFANDNSNNNVNNNNNVNTNMNQTAFMQ